MQKYIQKSSNYIKISLKTKETQIKTRYTCTLIRMDKVHNIDNSNADRNVEQQELSLTHH